MASSRTLDQFFLFLEKTLSSRQVKMLLNPVIVYVVSIALATYTNVYILSYIMLALYSIPFFTGISVRGETTVKRVLHISLYPILIHIVMAGESIGLPHTSIYFFISAAAAALIEEAFFRHVLYRYGKLLSSLMYAIFHLSFRDPVVLLNSSLLFPSYFVLGVFLYDIYSTEGLRYSVLFHVLYNFFALTYSLVFNLFNVFLFFGAVSLSYLIYIGVSLLKRL